MSVPAFDQASLPQGPSCVHHFTVITIILVATVVASSQPKNLCQQNPVTFASQIHTIGSIDDALWAITKDDWNVYKLTPCKPANDSLVHCMEVDSPVEVDTKWPKLAESVRSTAKEKDFTFPVDASVVMDSSKLEHTVLAMYSDSFQTSSKYYLFDFGSNEYIETECDNFLYSDKGLWISSDLKDKAYRFLNSVKQLNPITITNDFPEPMIRLFPHNETFICADNDGLGVQFKKSDRGSKVDWFVSNGVLYRKQFYFFTSDKVYIFSDQAETESTKMLSVSLKDFFHCNEPTTMAPPSSARNATNPRVTTNSTHISTTAKSYSTIIIIVVVVIVLIVILALITAYFCWCRTKASKEGKSDGNTFLGSSSPNDSKVSVKAQTVSKGSLKQSQTKAKAVAPNTSFGKHMKGSSK